MENGAGHHQQHVPQHRLNAIERNQRHRERRRIPGSMPGCVCVGAKNGTAYRAAASRCRDLPQALCAASRRVRAATAFKTARGATVVEADAATRRRCGSVQTVRLHEITAQKCLFGKPLGWDRVRLAGIPLYHSTIRAQYSRPPARGPPHNAQPDGKPQGGRLCVHTTIAPWSQSPTHKRSR